MNSKQYEVILEVILHQENELNKVEKCFKCDIEFLNDASHHDIICGYCEAENEAIENEENNKDYDDYREDF
jgi:hypothetical protein